MKVVETVSVEAVAWMGGVGRLGLEWRGMGLKWWCLGRV